MECAKVKFNRIVSQYEIGSPYDTDGRSTVVPQTGCSNCNYLCMLEIAVEKGLITKVIPYESGKCVKSDQQ